MSDKIPVRTTMRPWEELHVDQAEYDDLLAQGLIDEQAGIAKAVAEQAADQPAAQPAKKKGPVQ